MTSLREFLSRPMSSGENDRLIGYDELGREVFETPLGHRYAMTEQERTSPAQMRNALAEAASDPLGTARGVALAIAEGAWNGVSAPGRALQGETLTYGDVADTAMDWGVLSAAGVVPEGALRAGAARDERFWHPASRIKLERPVDEMTFDRVPTGGLSDARTVDMADLQGEVLMPAFGDRTMAGAALRGVNESQLGSAVDLQGGADFMRSGGGVWASEPAAMRTRRNALAAVADEFGQEPILAYSAMGAQAGDFSRMMSDTVMQMIDPSRISREAAERFDNYVRANVDEAWPGILSPNAHQYVDGMTGSNRRLLWQEMDRSAYRSGGFPNVGEARLAITDGRLIGADPFDTGLTFGRTHPGMEVTDTPPDVHRTYGARIDGDYVGGLEASVPGEMIWRDFFGNRRAIGASPATDQRAFMMTPSIRQRVDQQMIDEVSEYLARVRAQGGPR